MSNSAATRRMDTASVPSSSTIRSATSTIAVEAEGPPAAGAGGLGAGPFDAAGGFTVLIAAHAT